MNWYVWACVLPRELASTTVIAVSIHPAADAEAACETIYSTVSKLQTLQPNAFLTITGDFNHVTLDQTLPTFHQFVNCPTRDNRTLELLYANARDEHGANALLPLGGSDHNLVLLAPKYITLVQWQ